MDSKITYLKKTPVWQKILGFTFFAFGLYELTALNFIGLISITLAYMFLKTEGSEIDLKSKTYRKITSVLGLKFGKWQHLDTPEYISVFNTSESVTVRAITAETTNSRPIILLNLFFENNRKVTVYKTEDGKDAFNVASHIADALMIDLLDATEKGNFRWVDKNYFRTEGKILHLD